MTNVSKPLAVVAALAVALALPVVKTWEGRRLVPYHDLIGKLTWCDGETRGVPKAAYSPAECDAITLAAIAGFEVAIRPCLPVELPVEVRAAFVVTTYNIGSHAFCGSSMSRRAKAGDLRGACNALLAWNKVKFRAKDGSFEWRVVRGLTLRREAERSLCLSGLQ